MKKLEKLNKNLFAQIKTSKIENLSSILGGNWIKYTLLDGGGDKEVRTGNQNGGGDATEPPNKDIYPTSLDCDMGIATTADRDTVTPNTTDVAISNYTDSVHAY